MWSQPRLLWTRLCFVFVFFPENQKSLSGSPAAPVRLLTFSVASKTQYLPLSSRSGFLLRGPIYLANEERNLQTPNTNLHPSLCIFFHLNPKLPFHSFPPPSKFSCRCCFIKSCISPKRRELRPFKAASRFSSSQMIDRCQAPFNLPFHSQRKNLLQTRSFCFIIMFPFFKW